ncbi:hypothetical protein DMUE_3569 [Dictyocoela muelleri]|nr:hypothetical protein DMUE_3569 [Dictyocoela muelleri]
MVAKKKSDYCYVDVVRDRKIYTLLPIIQIEIKSKSYIVSDKRSAYNNFNNCFQDQVNQSEYFVDHITKAHTQKIENLWMHLKKIKHYSYGINIDTLPDHLNVLMFFRNFKYWIC